MAFDLIKKFLVGNFPKSKDLNITNVNLEETKYCNVPVDTLLYIASAFLDIGEKGFKSELKVYKRLKELVSVIECAEIGFHRGHRPIVIEDGMAKKISYLNPELDEIKIILDYLSKKGESLFVEDAFRFFDYIVCTSPNGGIYDGFYKVREQKENIYILHFGDFPYVDFEDELKSIGSCINLQALVMFAMYFDEIDLASLPIDSLQKLQYLDLSQNELCDVPNNVLELPELRFLALSYNKLTFIPSKLKEMKNLKHLDLRFNDISHEEFEELEREMPWCNILK